GSNVDRSAVELLLMGCPVCRRRR
ncbi:MAG: hypothetical protein QG597_3968, partial [Actinomycetota bacterium]|nr:hypothetical protein [Actinomycetota bacterium]